MENENKDKKVILTDEELKEVAGGVVTDSYFTRCSVLPQYYCVKKITCIWDKAKNICCDKPSKS